MTGWRFRLSNESFLLAAIGASVIAIGVILSTATNVIVSALLTTLVAASALIAVGLFATDTLRSNYSSSDSISSNSAQLLSLNEVLRRLEGDYLDDVDIVGLARQIQDLLRALRLRTRRGSRIRILAPLPGSDSEMRDAREFAEDGAEVRWVPHKDFGGSLTLITSSATFIELSSLDSQLSGPPEYWLCFTRNSHPRQFEESRMAFQKLWRISEPGYFEDRNRY